MKTIKLFMMTGLVVTFLFTANFSNATSGEAALAKQELYQTITEVFEKDLPKKGNYLYENYIYKLNDKVAVTFKVKEDGEVKVLEVKSKNYDASQYTKHVFSSTQVKAKQLLAGKTFQMDIHVKFKAK